MHLFAQPLSQQNPSTQNPDAHCDGNVHAMPATVGATSLAYTTDSFVVQPLFFPGGNIGHLAINGTVNDLAMCGAQPLFVLDSSQVLLMPEIAWQFTPATPRHSASGWLQGATLKFGKGRIAVFGEAAMFSAQLAGPAREAVGMNSPQAPQNYRFLLNTLRWLAGELGS